MNKKLLFLTLGLSIFGMSMVAMEEPIEPGRSREQVKSEMTASFAKMQQFMQAALACQTETQEYKVRYDKGEFDKTSNEFKTYRSLMVKMAAMINMRKKENVTYQSLKAEYELFS